MSSRLAFLLALLPALVFSAEGDIPIVQGDGTTRTKPVTGHVSIDADGETTVNVPLSNVSGAGTAAAADTGTNAGDVPVLGTGGALPAVSGEALTAVPHGRAGSSAADIATGALTLNAAACDPGDILYRRLTGDTVDVTVGSDMARCELWLDSDDGTHTAGWTDAGDTILGPAGYWPELTPPAASPLRLLLTRLSASLVAVEVIPYAQVLP